MRKHGFRYIILLCSLLLVCCSEETRDSDVHTRVCRAAERAYEDLARGEYEYFVDKISYVQNTDETYRQQLIDLMRDHTADLNQRHGGLKSVHAISDTLFDDTHATVNLLIEFDDGIKEETLLPMLKTKDGWRIQ